MASQCAPRHVCPKCKQELSRSAYNRHQNAPSCCPVGEHTQHPPLVPPPVENEVTVSDEITDSPESPDTNGGGGVESDMEYDSGTEAGEGELEVAEPATPFTEPESDHRPTNIVKAISFLFFFQLKYRVSDRAISLLLLFIGTSCNFISSFLCISCFRYLSKYSTVPKVSSSDFYIRHEWRD